VPQQVSELDVGTYNLAIALALAQDLAARAADWDADECTFTDGTLRVLVPRYGQDILHGLRPDLPAWRRAAITRAVQELEDAAAARARPGAAGSAAAGPGPQLPGTVAGAGGAPYRANDALQTPSAPPTPPPGGGCTSQDEIKEEVRPGF
jgi:hypothetical protein